MRVAGQRFAFTKGERIHTEYSYKYDEAGIAALADQGGFAIQALWKDPGDLFAVALLR